MNYNLKQRFRVSKVKGCFTSSMKYVILILILILSLAQERRQGESLSREAGDHSGHHPGAHHRGGDGTRAEDDAVTL